MPCCFCGGSRRFCVTALTKESQSRRVNDRKRAVRQTSSSLMDTLVTDDEIPVAGIKDALSIQLNFVTERRNYLAYH